MPFDCRQTNSPIELVDASCSLRLLEAVAGVLQCEEQLRPAMPSAEAPAVPSKYDQGGLEDNVALNHDACASSGGSVSTARLAWGVEEDIAAVASAHPDGFDLVVASDVLYESQRYPELWATLERFAGSSEAARTQPLPDITAAAAVTVESGLESSQLDALIPACVAVLGYQIRNGAERRFGDESDELAVLRSALPQPARDGEAVPGGRNPTGKNIAYVLRKGSAVPPLCAVGASRDAQSRVRCAVACPASDRSDERLSSRSCPY